MSNREDYLEELKESVVLLLIERAKEQHQDGETRLVIFDKEDILDLTKHYNYNITLEEVKRFDQIDTLMCLNPEMNQDDMDFMDVYIDKIITGTAERIYDIKFILEYIGNQYILNDDRIDCLFRDIKYEHGEYKVYINNIVYEEMLHSQHFKI